MVPDPSPLRPTKAVVVDAVCDLLRPVIRDLCVLELFAGTARVSCALLEEGARLAYAVDRRDPPDDAPERLRWLRRDAAEVVREGPPQPVGAVYLDPPYGAGHARELLPEIGAAPWLEARGIVVVETAEATELPDEFSPPADLYLMRKRRYGGTRLWIYQRGREQPGYRPG